MTRKVWRLGSAVAVAWASGQGAHGQYALYQVVANTAANPISRPVYVTHAPGDYKRLFIVEKQGRIRVLDITKPAPELQQDTAPFLDIRTLIPTLAAGNTGNQDERGLLGLAFHPQYMSNGRFYVYYTALPVAGLPNSAQFYCNVVEYTNPTPDGNTADVNSARIVMQIPHPQSNHNGGWMGFGPDGFLYISVGDGGGAGDDDAGHTAIIGNGQDTGSPLGKILRIDVNVTTTPPQGPFVAGSIASYGIPADNPVLVQPPLATGNRREIWAWGLRNAWRCSFDRLTGDLWMGDVGQNIWEEINYQPALTATNAAAVGGRNYGWRCWEGTVAFSTTVGAGCPTSYDAGGLTGPVGVYVHTTVPPTPPPLTFTNISSTCSITGGYVYRGCAVPELAGLYFFTDYCSGRIYTTSLNGSGVLEQPVDRSVQMYGGSLVTTPTIPSFTRPQGALVSFGEDAYGELYVVDQPQARVFKLVRATAGKIVNANCDFNFDGSRTVQDIFDYLFAYFTGSITSADFNRSGTLGVQDVFDFLACYFDVCPR